MMPASNDGERRVTSPEEKADQDVAREICSRLEFAGRRFRWGQFVAILGGQVVAVGASFDEVQQILIAQEPNPRKGLICQVEEPMTDVIRHRI